MRILTPRSERRLSRVMHAFGPITGAFFAIVDKGAKESVSEHDLGLGYPLGIEADAFARTFELALEARGVPFARIGGEDRDVSLDGARWILCATSGGLNPELFRRLDEKAEEGVARHARPARARLRRRLPRARRAARPRRLRAPRRRPSTARLSGATASPSSSRTTGPPPTPPSPARSRILGLPTWACDPDGIFATVHEDAAGRARVVFLVNPGEGDVVARVHVGALAGTRAVDSTTRSSRSSAARSRCG